MFKKIFPSKTITLPNGKTVDKPFSFTWIIVILLLVFSYFALEVTGFNLEVFENMNNFFSMIIGMFPPDFSYAAEVVGPLVDTLKMSFVGSLLGALTAMPIAILAASNITRNVVINGICKFFLSILRTIPSLVSAIIATFIFGTGTFAGTVAIFMFSLSYIGKLLYESIETVDMGVFECMESMGFTRFYAFRYAILPLVLPTYISQALYNFEGNVRYASILGYVGAGGIGIVLNEKIGWREYPKVGMILLILLATVLVIEAISAHFRGRLE